MRDEQLAELGQLRSQQADRARKFATRFASRLADVVGSPAAEMDDAAAQDACAGMLTVAQDMLMAADTTPADRTEALGFLHRVLNDLIVPSALLFVRYAHIDG